MATNRIFERGRQWLEAPIIWYQPVVIADGPTPPRAWCPEED